MANPHDKQCPKCGRWLTEDTLRCDCGFDLAETLSTPKPANSCATSVVVAGVLVLITALLLLAHCVAGLQNLH